MPDIAAQKSDIKKHWGAEPRAGIDPEVPMTSMHAQGRYFALRVEHWSSSDVPAVLLTWHERSDALSELGFEIRADPIEPMLAAILELEDDVSMKTWRRHFTTLEQRFGVSVFSECRKFSP